MYGKDDNEWASAGRSQTFQWHKVPWWVIWYRWRGKNWYRRIFDGADRGAGWLVEYATDAEALRYTLEENFGQRP